MEASVMGRISIFSYALIGSLLEISLLFISSGVVVVIVVGISVSIAFPVELSVKEKQRAFACTYAGLEMDLSRRYSIENAFEDSGKKLIAVSS
jgi:hypothetical protein